MCSLMQQSAITLEPQGVTGSAAYGRIGLLTENLFVMNLRGEYGFKGLMTQNVRKTGVAGCHDPCGKKTVSAPAPILNCRRKAVCL